MKCSVIVSVLDSHDFFQRQMRRFQEIMPANFELIVMDDGSEKPLAFQEPTPFPFRLIATNDRRPWTSNMARSQAAKLSKSDYLLMTDIDHVFTREALAAVASFSDDMLTFERRTATGLDEAGVLVVAKSDRLSPHCNTFAIRRDLFARTGYLEVYRGYGHDHVFRERYKKLVYQGKVSAAKLGPTIFVVPSPPQGFHKLRRERIA